jgi:GNAT superfamily N-acetyltransferase
VSTSPSVRRFAPDEWRIYRQLRLQALAESPDAFGRTLSEEEFRPDAEWSARLASDSGSDLPLVAEVNGKPLGLAWGKRDPSSSDTAHLYQMWVAPAHRRLRVGQLLLDGVIAWATAADVRWMVLGVNCGDTPAMRLYLRAGFKPTGEPGTMRCGVALLGQPMRAQLKPRAA